jgi:hypothetical protein
LRRAGVAEYRSRTSTDVPRVPAAGSTRPVCAVEQVRVRVALAVRLVIRTRATDAIEASASPRKPSVTPRARGRRASRDLAGGMPLQRQREFVGRDAAAVVATSDAAHAALLDAQFDRRGARVDRVLEQFLDDRCGPLDDLAGGDLADQHVGERLDRPTAARFCRTLRRGRRRASGCSSGGDSGVDMPGGL